MHNIFRAHYIMFYLSYLLELCMRVSGVFNYDNDDFCRINVTEVCAVV